MTSIADNPTPVNLFPETSPIKNVVQWVTVLHRGGVVCSYPMFKADDGSAWLEMHENLQLEDKIVAVSPCTEKFFVIENNEQGQLDMGTTPEEVQSWAKVTKKTPHRRPVTPIKVAAHRSEEREKLFARSSSPLF